MKLRVGIVGLGAAWKQRHRLALKALSDRFEVKAICAEVSALAESAAREFNAAPVDGFRALALREDIDAVLIFSPEWFGHLPVLAACDAEKAVYCTSTFDFAPEEAAEIRRRVEQSGISFMAEFPRRLAPATIRLKELIATRLGKPQLLFCHARVIADSSGKKNAATTRPGMRGLVELVDWCRYVVGFDPSSVMAIQHICPDQSTDYQMMSLDFSRDGKLGSGPVAQISSGSYIPPSWPEAVAFRPPAALQVSCERGVAFIDLPAGLVWFDEAGRHVESLESERPVGEQLLVQFYQSVTSLIRRTSSLDDSFRALHIVDRASESFEKCQRTNLFEGWDPNRSV
jgi:predicted dehydrogenase